MQSNETSIPDDEIDFGLAGRKVKTFVNYPVRLLLTNIKITLAFIFAALLISIVIKYIVPRTYQSSFIIRPNDRTEKFHLKMIGDLQTMLKHKDYNTIAAELKISDDIARSLRKISAENPYVKNRTDSINNTEVTLETLDYNNLMPIQEGILSYLENNPYFHKITELQKKQVIQSLELVETDLERLDKLKLLQIETYHKIGTFGQNSLLLNDMVNPTSVYTMAAERMNKKSLLLGELAFLGNFQVVKNCVIVRHHHWPPRILVTCLWLVPFALLICFLFLHFRRRPAK
jgi:hypothetical protein